MSYAANVHVAVYRVLDDVITSCAAPLGAKGEIYAIIDKLQSVSASRAMVTMAEGISLLIHQLETALREGNKTSELAARSGLKHTAAAWLKFRLLN